MSAPAAFTPAATVVSTSSPASAGLSGKREQKNERRRGRIEVEVDAPAIKAELDEVLKKHDKVIKELREDSEGRRGKKDRDD
jgi:hypothetical protein